MELGGGVLIGKENFVMAFESCFIAVENILQEYIDLLPDNN